MAATFRENERMQSNANAIQRAMMKLSNAGYFVLGASAKRETIFSIELDSPYQGPAANHKTHKEKQIGSCEAFGCRLYWEIKSSEAAV